MDVFQKIFEKTIEDAPYKLVTDLIVKKLAEKGVRVSNKDYERLKAQVQRHDFGRFCLNRWQFWNRKSVVVNLSNDEIDRIWNSFKDLLDESKLSEVIQDSSEQIAPIILESLKNKWGKQSNFESRQFAAFRNRLENYWSVPLQQLQMLLSISREFGDAINNELRNTPDESRAHLIEVLTRSHGRACQITHEIIWLLSGGFADGAIARWRSLHEISVISAFISEHGEELAERYVAHQVVETLKAVKEYNEFKDQLNLDPFTDEEIARYTEERDSEVKKYGKAFSADYGWAAKHLNDESPTFKKIEQKTDASHFRPHYRLASHNVHANPKGIFMKLGLIEESEMILAGPSNFGFADPGKNTALSLLHISADLMMLFPTVDTMVIIKVMTGLAMEICDEFDKCQQELENAEYESAGQ